MSLDITLTDGRKTTILVANFTHNCGTMAKEAGIYMHLWRPEEIGITTAEGLIDPLKAGLALMKADPARFIALEPDNKWGTYRDFLPWVEEYLKACIANPDAEISVDR